jgi:hypothetical protein
LKATTKRSLSSPSKTFRSPIGVSTYTVTRELPKGLEQEVPSIEDRKGVVEKLRTELAAVRKAEQAELEEEK